MQNFKNKIQTKYGLSNYQIAQLTFLYKSISSELSKILIMSIIFYNKLSIFVFLLFIMCLLRSFSGGLHFYTYAKCLAASTMYIGIVIYFLSNIVLPLYLQILLLMICILSCYINGPILSKYRTNFPKKQLYFGRNFTCLFIFIYTIIIFIIPYNPYFTIGTWMIILHSLQLFAAKISKKGEW